MIVTVVVTIWPGVTGSGDDTAGVPLLIVVYVSGIGTLTLGGPMFVLQLDAGMVEV